MRSRPVFIKQLFYFLVPVLVTVILFTSCQTTTTTSSDIGDWAAINEFGGSPRSQAVSFVINNTVYVGTGYNGNYRLTDFWSYNETTQAWIQIAPFPGSAVNGAVAFAVTDNTGKTKGYVGGGFDGTYYHNDFYSYDPSNNTWSTIASYPDSAMSGAIGFSLGNLGYVGGGSYPVNEVAGNPIEYSESMWAYDPSSNSWSQVASLLQKRTGSTAFVYNGIGYVVGGTNNFGSVVDVEAYNPNVNLPHGLWNLRRPIITVADSSYSSLYGYSITRSNTAAFLINDTAYLATGYYNGIIGTTWAYDIGNDQWFPKTSFEGTARENAIGFTINNHGYLVTGDNGSNYYDDLWEFYPDATAITSDNYP
jgi:N-acetylneuraminic acid mutarotase